MPPTPPPAALTGQPHALDGAEEAADLPRESSRRKTLDASLLAAALSIDSMSDRWKSMLEKPQILLQGPAKSGRSSLAMDFAAEMAANAVCQCNSRQCLCKPVAFLRPESKASSFFPMRCYRSGVDESGVDFRHRMQELLKTSTSRDNNTTIWNPNTLKRIQVHHLASFRDCLQYLLCLQGKPKHEQPYSAIIIDDIDWLSNESVAGSDGGSMQVSELLAILFDTVNFLNARPMICVSLNSTSEFSADCFMASFFSSVVSLQASHVEPAFLDNLCQDTKNSDVVLSSWDVCINREGAGEGGKCAEFSICRTHNECQRIRWNCVI